MKTITQKCRLLPMNRKQKIEDTEALSNLLNLQKLFKLLRMNIVVSLLKSIATKMRSLETKRAILILLP